MFRMMAVVGISLLLNPISFSKEKSTLPADILTAQTVLVVIEPDAGEPLINPGANSTAREDVERALTKWGRFKLVIDAQTADLIVTVRTGAGRMVNPTIHGGRVDDRPVMIQPGQGGDIRLGGQQGHPPDLSQTGNQSSESGPSVQTEVGSTEDMLAVYRGKIDYPLDSPSVWRYVGKDALRAPTVRAVDEFRKALNDAEKAQNQKQKKKP